MDQLIKRNLDITTRIVLETRSITSLDSQIITIDIASPKTIIITARYP
jgi:hypothetical protein